MNNDEQNFMIDDLKSPIQEIKQKEHILLVSQNQFEIKAAYLENLQLRELFIEKRQNRSLVNNIYKAKVSKIIPGMQSAFVEITPDQSAFLYVDDLRYLNVDDLEDKEIFTTADQLPQSDLNDSSIDLFTDAQMNAQTSILTDLQVATDTISEEPNTYPIIPTKQPIQQMLHEGQELLVQVSKDPISTKGARVTTRIALAGRYLVYIPKMEQISVSRRISQEAEKERLEQILQQLLGHQTPLTEIIQVERASQLPKRIEGGLIARTAAQDCDFSELQEDFLRLYQIWKNIQKEMDNPKTHLPSLLYKELNLPLRVLRDLSSVQLSQMLIDSHELKNEIVDLINKYHPNLIDTQKIKVETEDIFEKYGVDAEINRALNRKVFLPSGGYLIIDQTEALTSIDVNTGKYVGKFNFEETILNNNLEAVKEIAYQIKIRNLGGMIILDLIDMEKQDDKDRVYTALLDALTEDRIKCNVSTINELGLIEITRKRERDSLIQTICEPCFYCQGNGYLKNPYKMTQEIYRELSMQLPKMQGVHKVKLEVHPHLYHEYFHDSKAIFQHILDLSKSFGKEVILMAKETLHFEQFLYSALE
jgi:ribonuclease G